jgi:small subunit ribosomal protein S1
MTLQAGDSVELYVVSMAESDIRLSKALSGIGGLNTLKDAYANEIPVEGTVSQTCKGGFNVEILKHRAFCPISQMDLKYVENADDYVGQTGHFLITQFEGNGKNIVVSRKKILAQEQEKAAKQFYETLTADAILTGQVTRILPFGAFVELSAGVEGMVHISELSWSRIENPEEVVAVGDTLTVKVLEIKTGDSPSRKKIALSVKHLEDDPWNTAGDRFEIGQKITGKVTKCVKFGVFVEIVPGIEGLVHISEMSYTQRVLNPEDLVSPGQTVSVTIKEFDLAKRRVSLSLRDAEGDPWLNVPEKYRVGQAVEGVIEKKMDFGYFIRLEPGITGLLPKSSFSKAANPANIEKLKDGDAIKVTIEKVTAKERKVTLGPADLAEEGNWKDFTKDDGKSMSPLAEKLRKALKDKG